MSDTSPILMKKGKDAFARAAGGFGAALLLACGLLACGIGGQAMAQEAVDRALIQQAYNYAFPLYKLSQYRWTALETNASRTSTTLNRLAHSRAIATPQDRWAAAPIVDALYSTAWIDLARGPVLVDTPDTQGRYYVLTLIDFYSNTFFYAGYSSTGTQAQKYLLAGPTWQGEVPAGATLVRAPGNDVYVNLRVLVDGPADQGAANAVQDGFRITPAATAGAAAAVPRIRPVAGDPKNFVDVVNQMLELDPPPAHDARLIERYRAIGICGKACSWERLPAPVQAAWRADHAKFEGQFLAAYLAAGAAHGWIEYNPAGSKLGTTQMRDYDLRASALALGMGMLGLARTEADYWITLSDSRGQALSGGQRYRLSLPPGGLPARAFWSVALYTVEKEGQFLSGNAHDRYHVSSRTPGLVTNADGTIDIWLQPTPPAGPQRANWLPTPADGGPFELFARAYVPGDKVLNGEFKMPPVLALP
ncbi:DUF1254 domain-containing protein [Cupriavidus basilensis]|nr:DUF1254 domain-containing protein [Cupriavidus basilensis]